MDQKPNQQKVPAMRTLASDMSLARESGPSLSELPVVKTGKDTIKLAEKTRLVKTPVKPIISSVDKKISDKHKSAATLKPIPKIVTDSSMSAHSGTSFIVDNEDAATATVITDTKKDRFKLFPSITESIKRWFLDYKKSKLIKKTPKYSVPETSLRKGIIQKATSNTGRSVTADFSSIQERILRRKEEDATPKPSLTWSANTETGFLLLEDPLINIPTNVQVTERKSFRNTKPAPILVTEATETPIIANVSPVAAARPIVDSQPGLEAEYLNPASLIPEPTATAEEVSVDESESNIEFPEPEISGEISAKPAFSFWALNTNLLSLIFSGVAIILIVVISLNITKPTKSENDLPQTNAKAILSDSNLLELNITNLNALTSEQLNEIKSKTGQTEVLLNIEAVTLLNQISPNLDLSFVQNVKSIHFGYTNEDKPFIVMTFSDEIATKGGLLMWEKALYNDFVKVFKLDNPSKPLSKFIDGRGASGDVRVLKDDRQNELLIYGYQNNSIIITNDVYAYTNLIN